MITLCITYLKVKASASHRAYLAGGTELGSARAPGGLRDGQLGAMGVIPSPSSLAGRKGAPGRLRRGAGEGPWHPPAGIKMVDVLGKRQRSRVFVIAPW